MTERELDRRLAAAVEGARAAGRLVLAFFRRGIPARAKGRLDVVTEADRRSERFLRRFLLDDQGRLDLAFQVVHNGRDWLRRDQLDRPIAEGDVVTITMLVGGG